MADVTRVSTFTLAGEASTRRSAAPRRWTKRAAGQKGSGLSERLPSARSPPSWHSRIIHQPFVALIPGVRLGPYEILSPLGAGGMGEVYRARDTKLDRDVAIKILPDAFVSDPERVARFQREAKTLASLNHPNIGGIYGLEESEWRHRARDGTRRGRGSVAADRARSDPDRRGAADRASRSPKPSKRRTSRGSSIAI